MVTKVAKTNSIITHDVKWVDEAGESSPVVTFKVLGVGEFTLDIAKISAANQVRGMVHGFIQRVSDGGAISRDPETGLPATAEAKYDRMKKIAEFYEAGGDEWTMKAAPGSRGPDAGLILTAMCRTVAEGSIDKANAMVDQLATKRGCDRNESLRAWGNTAQVLTAIGQIKAERAPTGADALLLELAEGHGINPDLEGKAE